MTSDKRQVLQLWKRNEMELEEGKWGAVRSFLDTSLKQLGMHSQSGRSGLMVILTSRLLVA